MEIMGDDWDAVYTLGVLVLWVMLSGPASLEVHPGHADDPTLPLFWV